MMECNGKPVSELVAASLQSQVSSAAADSLGLCIFGRSVTDTSTELVVDAINNAHGTELEASFFEDLGRETLTVGTPVQQGGRVCGLKTTNLPQFFL